MNEQHEQHTSSNVEHRPPTPVTGHAAPPASEGASQGNEATPQLTTFMKVSIALLVAVTLASISLLFIGDFEGKFERVFSTLALFTIFVLLTAFDTRRERVAHWYAPIALIANAYILGLLLIIIWVTPYDAVVLQMRITWTSVYIIVVTRVVVWAVGALLRIGTSRPDSVARWGQVTSVFAILTLILFTAPLGIEAFDVHVPDLYWRIAVATLILTGLGLAVTLLLSWYYRPAPPANEVPANAYGTPTPAPWHPGAGPVAGPAPVPAAGAPFAPSAPHPGVPQQPVPSVTATAPQYPVQQYPAPQQPLPWPTFADGSPYPMGADGQPDFAAVERMHASTTESRLHEPAHLAGDVNDSVVPGEPAVAASSVLAEDPGIHADSVVAEEPVEAPAEDTAVRQPKPETTVQEGAILLPEMSQAGEQSPPATSSPEAADAPESSDSSANPREEP